MSSNSPQLGAGALVGRTLNLLSLLLENPVEFYDRAVSIATSRLEISRGVDQYCTSDLSASLALLSDVLRSDCVETLREPARSQIEMQVRERRSLLAGGPFTKLHDADPTLATLCYALTRTLRPKMVVETGVCYGVTSAYILRALNVNQEGHLHSIDLPPLAKDGDKHVGRLVPEEFRDRWTLHRGISRRILPPLLERVGKINLFVHDSLHTYRNMAREFAIVWPFLRPRGILISDDIENNPAFRELSQRSDVAASVIVRGQAKDCLVGIAVKRA